MVVPSAKLTLSVILYVKPIIFSLFQCTEGLKVLQHEEILP